MSSYSFELPGPPIVIGIPAGTAGSPTGPGQFGGQLDQLIHPVSLDYVRTIDGEWVQTADSRTIMLIAISVHLGESPFDPQDGTAIAEFIRTGELVSPEMLQSEVMRVGQILTDEGVIADLLVAVRDSEGQAIVDEGGVNVVKTSWRDLASGSPLNATFTSR